MNVKKTVKKIIALGTGATMVGATILGAMAYDLADYPANYIVDGVFDGTIVVGEKAATNDVLGAIDIAAALQAASTSKESVKIPGASGEVSLEGDAFKIGTSNDQLELRENVGDVVDTITESNLAGLKSGHISTSEGDTDYFQYLRLKDSTNLQNFSVNYHENDDNVISDYLVIDADAPFLEWEIQFPEGFESERETNGDLDDYDDKSFNILGTDFNVVSSSVNNDSTDFTWTLMGGSLSDTLREGETKTYTLDGVEYEVTLIFVSDPQSGSSVEAKFMVNGEVTPAMSEGDTETVSGGIQIGVRDILANARDGVASFFLGADKVQMTDATTDGSSTFDGTIKVNNENINDGDIEVLGSFTDATDDTFEVTSIKYRLTMDADSGSVAYIEPGHGIKEFMDKPEALISDSLDLYYEGLTTVDKTDVKLDSKGDDEYRMTFTNILGEEYTMPFISNDAGAATQWKFGDKDDELIFVESTAATNYTIGRQDYFIVSNARDDQYKSVTNVLRYEDYDSSSRTLEFENLASGNTLKVTVTAGPGGNGDLVVGGHTYKVYVNSSTAREPLLSIDLNGDSGFNDIINVTTWGGMVIELANKIELSGTMNWTSADGNTTGLQLAVRNGYAIADMTNYTASTSRKVWSEARVDSSLFDTSTNDEVFSWYVSRAANDEADLSFSSGTYTGPLAGSDDWNEFDWADRNDDDDHQVGMTDYGIIIDEYNPSGNDPNELVMSVPEMQVLGQVFVTLGSVEATEGGAGVTTEVVNPISVGLAVLDKDAPGVGTDNLIVVGGPCANTVAAELLGNPSPCGSGFTPGKALIKSWESNGKVSILVAGYEAQETLGASYVLANHGDYAALQGEEVEVVVPDLSNLVVQAVTMDSGDDTGDDGNQTA